MAMTTLLEDGRWQHTFRQSSIKTSTICLERARREWTGEAPNIETDAACVGTACHAAFEASSQAWMTNREWFDQYSTIELFERAYDELEALPNFRYVKYTPDEARKFGRGCVRNWYQEIRPALRPRWVELTFDLPLYEDDHRVIRLSGTMDLIDERAGLCDYKTSGGGKYQEWQYQRWAIQPTAYTYAAAQLGMPQHANRFTYIVLHASGVQQFTVERSPGDWAWMTDQCRTLATLIESGLEQWPKNDTHALCSAKWCQSHSDCKGSHYTEET